MPWYVPWSESIKKRACRYLLQRYLGQFLEEKLTLDQLSVDIYNGTGTVADVSLDVQALNELAEQQSWPVELVDGYIEAIFVSIPWSSLLSEASFVEVKGFTVTVRPKQRNDNGTSMFESMWSSMTSSMQLAQECLKQEAVNEGHDMASPPEGLELFAQTIDSILSRVKIRFVDTVIRLEHIPKDSNFGIAVQINIKNLEYLDEAGNDPPSGEATEIIPQEHNMTYVVSSFTTKKFYLEGVTLHTDEFPSRSRLISKSVTLSQINPDLKSDPEFLSAVMDDLNINDSAAQCKSEYFDSTSRINTSTDENFFMTKTEMTESNDFCELETKQTKKESEKPCANEQQEPIMFAKLSGRQEIRVKLKQSETVNGPKVNIEVTLGSITMFLSPRQVHSLIELFDNLLSPDADDDSNLGLKQRCVEKPMDKADFQRVEQELQQQLHPLSQLQTTGLQYTHGWSTASLDDSDEMEDQEFQPMRGAGGGGMSDSVLSNASSIDSSIASSASSQTSSRATGSTRTSVPRRRRDTEQATEIWQLELRTASLAVVLLHDDLLTVSDSTDHPLAPASVKHASNTAQTFFSSLGLFSVSYGNKDFDNAAKVFEKACNLNHIRVLGAPIQLESNQKSTNRLTKTWGQLTVARLDIVECLMPELEVLATNAAKSTIKTSIRKVELLKFDNENINISPQHGLSGKPNLKVIFKRAERPLRQIQGKKYYYPKTELSFYLENCRSECDFTMIDRLSALINSSPLFPSKISPDSNRTFGNHKESIVSEYKFDIKVESPFCDIKLRFPIPDMRPLHDIQRRPWWQQNIRSDYLTFQLEDACLQVTLHSRSPATRVQLCSRVVHVSYTEADSDISIPIAKTTSDSKAGSSYSDTSNWPRLLIYVYPHKSFNGDLDESSGADSEPHCFAGLTRTRIPSPFSSKRVVHESDTPHSKHIENTEELVIPGDRQEMTEFVDYAQRSARIQIEVSLPCVSLQLVGKHIYELLYNRIATDLLLWEPTAPRHSSTTNGMADLTEPIHPAFAMCKSGIHYESDSEESEDEGVYYSIYENRQRQRKKQLALNMPAGQSYLALTINISKGLLSLYTPVRDSSANVIPGQHGETAIYCESANIFTVSGYRGNLDLSYVCVQSKNASLYHCGLISSTSQIPVLREVGNPLPKHLLKTIYSSENGVKQGCADLPAREMLSIAIRIQANDETHHMKVVKVACGVSGGTLRHRACPEPQSWLSELQDMFNVDDYDIAGYDPPGVLVEVHLHLWSCAVDYRPLHLPLRAVLTTGSFSMSCNLVAQTHTSTLRFIAEDCALLLSELCNTTSVDLRKNYVCVADLGLFELSVRYHEKIRGVNPQVDLRASNNIVHVRTCSDSGRALTQLITYMAADGDLVLPADAIGKDGGSDTDSIKSQLLLNVDDQPQQICELSQSQHQHVINVLDEAMKEDDKVDDTLQDNTYEQPPAGVEIFFFPDEAVNVSSSTDNGKPLPQVVRDLGDTSFVPVTTMPLQKNSDTDDEFCILGEEAGLGFLPKDGLPDIRWLTREPVQIIDNHFAVPLGKTDLLKPPKHFPPAVFRYTLFEMTLIWHMYGGRDFSEIKTTDKKTVNFSPTDNHYTNPNNDTVSFSKSDPYNVKFSSTKIPSKNNDGASRSNWLAQGGPDRRHDILMELQLNKVRFQHEVYPENTTQASRQVLLVSEVEVRDRLATSHINKFLYQYSSELRPKQTHANMIVIKAVHLRPDPKLKAQECCLKISLLPLRLNIDQDSLLFLIDFFTELGGTTGKAGSDSAGQNTTSQKPSSSRHNTPTHQPPVMTVNYPSDSSINDSIDKQEAQMLVSENLILLAGTLPTQMEEKSTKPPIDNNDDSIPIYFRTVVFSPEVPVRIDYQGKRVDMSHPGGALAGLLMGLGQLNCSELRLKRLNHRHGLLGFDKLLSYALHEWLSDIKKNQLPSLLGGVGPMHALVQLFQGIRDLFWLPIEQYQKDGRIVRGLQRGANSFTTSTAMAALELTSRIIHLIQATAETAYDMVSPGPSVRRRSQGRKGKRRRYNQPQDFREGVANAYSLVKEGLGETAHTIVRVASLEHEQKGYSGAVGGVLRQIPPTVVKPIILATEATNNVLGGMVCQLVPDARREASQKWRTDDSFLCFNTYSSFD